MSLGKIPLIEPAFDFIPEKHFSELGLKMQCFQVSFNDVVSGERPAFTVGTHEVMSKSNHSICRLEDNSKLNLNIYTDENLRILIKRVFERGEQNASDAPPHPKAVSRLQQIFMEIGI